MSNKLIIGSEALKAWFPDDYPREPNDLDYVVPEEEIPTDREKGVEYLINPVLLKHQPEGGYLRPSALLALKMSHMYWPINWRKHMYDIQFLLGKTNVQNIGLENDLIDYWDKTKTKVKKSNLELSPDEFFTNAVNKDVHEHDLLHTLINPVPAYTKVLKNDGTVGLCEKRWNSLSWGDKMKVVKEETCVMAYERSQGKYYRFEYEKQLEKNIQRHFPRFVARFAILNYVIAVECTINYKEVIDKGLKKLNNK